MVVKNVVRRVSVGAGLLGLVAVTGCSESRVPVGAEGDAINSGQCLGKTTKCTQPPSADTLASRNPRVCNTTPVGTYSSTFASEFVSGQQAVTAADGSAWVLGQTYGTETVALWARHFDANGELLGQNDGLVETGSNTGVFLDIAPGPGGGAAVYVYSMFAQTADDALTEHATVLQLDPEGNVAVPEVPVTGMSVGRLAVGSQGTVTIAASASGRSPVGRLVRITDDGAPVFIQSNVPANEQSIGAGISLLLQARGASMILSERSRSPESQEATFGIAGYDAAGNLTNNWLLPMTFPGGSRATLARTPAGTLVVQGSLDPANQRILGYSDTGEPLFAWHLPGAEATLTIDALTGAIVVNAQGGPLVEAGPRLAVISADGSQCQVYASSGDNSYVAGTVTFSDGWALTREGLAAE